MTKLSKFRSLEDIKAFVDDPMNLGSIRLHDSNRWQVMSICGANCRIWIDMPTFGGKASPAVTSAAGNDPQIISWDANRILLASFGGCIIHERPAIERFNRRVREIGFVRAWFEREAEAFAENTRRSA